MLRHRRFGFTLIELLIVVSIIAILLALLIPTISQLGQTMTRLRCKTNLKKVHQVVTSYAAKYKGQLPAMGTESISENVLGNPPGYGTPADHHLMAEELKACGAKPEYFCCPAHPYFEDIKAGSTAFYRWDNKDEDGGAGWKVSGTNNWSKYYSTPGYQWLTHSENFSLHPRNVPVTVMPNHWVTWSRFVSGRYLPERNDQLGNPPICFDIIKFDDSSGSVQGCWHDPHREPLSGSETDANCTDFGGGGHTLFLAGDVIWFDVGELLGAGPSYEQQDNIWCYFGMEPPKDEQ